MKDTNGVAILREIAAEAIPEHRDPWPLIRARLTDAPPRRRAMRPLLAAGMIALLLAALSLGVPTTRAAIQSLGVSLLQPASVAPSLEPTAVPQPVSAASQPRGPQRSGTPVTVEVARERAAFPLRLPGWLPEGLQIEHAYLLPAPANGGQGVGEVDVVAYAPTGNRWLGIHQTLGQSGRPYGLDPNFVQAVSVADQPALYARGSWDSLSPTASESGWDPQADASILTWERDGVTYVLRAVGLGLDREELIRIAASLH